MKHFINFSFIIFSFFIHSEKDKLVGKYKIEYDKKYQMENCLLTINDSVYVKSFSNGKKINGKIKYWNYIVTLNDNDSDLQIEFDKSKIENDTISFGTKNTKGKGASYMEISVNTGNLIRIK